MTFSERRWQLVNVREVQDQAQIVIYQLVKPYKTGEQLLIYRTATGFSAQLTGTEGKDVTDRLPMKQWDDLYHQAQALYAIVGGAGKSPPQEII